MGWVNSTIVALQNLSFLSLFLSSIHSLCLYLCLSYFPVVFSLEHYLDFGGSGESKQEVLYKFSHPNKPYIGVLGLA